MINLAYAQPQNGAFSQETLMGFLPFLLIFVVMYFMIIRPQRLQAKKRSQMLAAIRRGDTIVTGGGLVAKVTRIFENDELEIDLGNGSRVVAIRGMVADVRIKGEPVSPVAETRQNTSDSVVNRRKKSCSDE